MRPVITSGMLSCRKHNPISDGITSQEIAPLSTSMFAQQEDVRNHACDVRCHADDCKRICTAGLLAGATELLRKQRKALQRQLHSSASSPP